MRVMSAQEIKALFVKLEKEKSLEDEAWLAFIEAGATETAIEAQEIHDGKIPCVRG